MMIFLPLLGAAAQAVIGPSAGERPEAGALVSKWLALISSGLASVCAMSLVVSMSTGVADLQLTETVSWVGSYAITYEMGVDGLNSLLVLLIAVVFPVLIAYEWRQGLGQRGMHGLLLVLQSAFWGTVCAQDLFLQLFFWGLSALPFYFLMGIWGGARREEVAFRTVIMTAIGNALLFAAVVIIYYSVEPHTFLMHDLAGNKLAGKTLEFFGSELSVPVVALSLIGAGLAFRAPIWPFHGWFTAAAEDAPCSVFIALSAVSVPVATHIFLRAGYSLFPETLAQAAPVLVLIGAVNLVVGVICATAQKSLKPLLAYLCLSETGLILIGTGALTPPAAVGAVYNQLMLGLGIAGFGLFTGILEQRAGSVRFADEAGSVDLAAKSGFARLGGVAAQAPWIATFAGVVVGSLIGFPGFAGFVGNALIVIGSYTPHQGAVAICIAAILLATFCLFTMYREVFLGKPQHGGELTDLGARERAFVFPVVLALVVFGFYPKPLLDLVRPTVLTLLSTTK